MKCVFEGCKAKVRLEDLDRHEASCRFQRATGSPEKSRGGALQEISENKQGKTVDGFEITCRKGCRKLIQSEDEYDTHDCMVWLKAQKQDLSNEVNMLDQHISEAESDWDQYLHEVDQVKTEKEKEGKALVQQLMEQERINERLKNKIKKNIERQQKNADNWKENSEKASKDAFEKFVNGL